MTPYITRNDLIALGYSPMPDSDVQDDICLVASVIADNFCQQTLGISTDEESINVKLSKSDNYNKAFTSFLPVNKINSIKKYFSLNQYVTVDPQDYAINNKGGYVELTCDNYGRLAISYDHGYSTIPEQAKRAVILIAANLLSEWRKRGQTNYERIKSLTDNVMKMEFFDESANEVISPTAKKLLLKFKRVR